MSLQRFRHCYIRHFKSIWSTLRVAVFVFRDERYFMDKVVDHLMVFEGCSHQELSWQLFSIPREETNRGQDSQ